MTLISLAALASFAFGAQAALGEAKESLQCSFLSTFPWGKVPVGRMRDLHNPHQSRCARQLPPGEAFYVGRLAVFKPPFTSISSG